MVACKSDALGQGNRYEGERRRHIDGLTSQRLHEASPPDLNVGATTCSGVHGMHAHGVRRLTQYLTRSQRTADAYGHYRQGVRES